MPKGHRTGFSKWAVSEGVLFAIRPLVTLVPRLFYKTTMAQTAESVINVSVWVRWLWTSPVSPQVQYWWRTDVDCSQLYQHVCVRRWTPEWARRWDPGYDVSERPNLTGEMPNFRVVVGIMWLNLTEMVWNPHRDTSKSELPIKCDWLHWSEKTWMNWLTVEWIYTQNIPHLSYPFWPPFTFHALCLVPISCLRG